MYHVVFVPPLGYYLFKIFPLDTKARDNINLHTILLPGIHVVHQSLVTRNKFFQRTTKSPRAARPGRKRKHKLGRYSSSGPRFAKTTEKRLKCVYRVMF